MDSKRAGNDSSQTTHEGLTPQAALERLLQSKREQRRQLAALPFAEKFRIVVQMQRLSESIKRARFITR
jgi:hypothetical protein